MKTIQTSTLFAIMALIVACSGEKSSFEQLVAQRDSLRAEQNNLVSQINELEIKIAEMDTTKKLVQVTSQSISRQTFEHYFDIYGDVKADQNVQLYSQSAGEILQILVKEGDQVSQGQLLMKIDDEVIRKNVEQIETQLRLANDVFVRQQRLWEKNIGSEMQFLEAKNAKEALQKQLEATKAQMNLTAVTAPFSGVIDEIFPKMGEMASPGMPLVRLVNLDEVYIKADVSEKYVANVRKGTDVKVLFPDLGVSLDTTVSLTGQYINPLNRTFTVRVALPNERGLLKPNLLAVLKVKDFEQDSAVVVPSDLIQQTAKGENFVYVLENHSGSYVAKRVIVETGISYEGNTHILKGLNGSEELIRDGARSVKDGQVVDRANA